MHTYHNADAGPHITPVSRWLRSGAVFLGTMALLGVAGSLYAKKPVKPPPEPEPPPLEVAGILYATEKKSSLNLVEIDLDTDRFASSQMFPVLTFGGLRPSVLDHGGRWFAGADYHPPYPAETRTIDAGPFQGNTELIVTHETGVTTTLIGVELDESGVPSQENLFEFSVYKRPCWIAGDTRLAVLARRLSLVPLEEDGYATNEDGSFEAIPVAGTGGIYLVDVGFSNINGVWVPALEGELELVLWTLPFGDNWSDDAPVDGALGSFSLSRDGSVMYCVIYEPAEGPGKEHGLYRFDVASGSGEKLYAASWLGAVESSPDGTAVAFSEGGIVSVLDSVGIDPVELPMEPSNRSFDWSPDGSQIAAVEFIARSKSQLVVIDPYAETPERLLIRRGDYVGMLGWRTTQ